MEPHITKYQIKLISVQKNVPFHKGRSTERDWVPPEKNRQRKGPRRQFEDRPYGRTNKDDDSTYLSKENE